MPLLDIATTRPVFQNDVCAVNSQILVCNRFKSGQDIRFSSLWKSFFVPEKAQSFGGVKLYRGGLMIRAVVTLEKESTKAKKINQDYGGCQSSGKKSIDSRNLNCSVVEQQSQIDESTELDEREKLRRNRISKANKGNTPWNKGRKHSPETLQKIRERTRLAMQDPKVKMKLMNLGHAQSKETRLKIGVGVRAGWEKRQKMLKQQDACYYEWQSLIAEASRKGLLGEEELQWNSYQILDSQLEEKWLHSVEQRKIVSRLKGNRRAPKSAEQKRKIAEAISAKWADPDYRSRVCSSLAKYHGSQDGVERKPRSEGQTRKRSPPKKKVDTYGVEVHNHPKHEIKQAKIKREYTPKYRDPLASSKLEMLMNIRAQRSVVDKEKIDAVKRARLLIAEAEKAAEALEIAAIKSPAARASLVETRNLIAEAIQSIEHIDLEEKFSIEIDKDQTANSDDSTNADAESLDEIDNRKMNGVHVLVPNGDDIHGFEFTKPPLHSLLNGNKTSVLSSSGNYDLLGNKEKLHQVISSELAPPQVEEGMHAADEVGEDEQKSPLPNKMTFHVEPLPNGLASLPKSVDHMADSTIVTKQWVRGRLVEVANEG